MTFVEQNEEWQASDDARARYITSYTMSQNQKLPPLNHLGVGIVGGLFGLGDGDDVVGLDVGA